MAIHCKAGIGRSGMLATSILIADGMQPELAFKTVSEARQINVPDTKEQADFVFSIAENLKNCPSMLGIDFSDTV